MLLGYNVPEIMLLGYDAPEIMILQCFKTILGTLQLTLKTRISLDIL